MHVWHLHLIVRDNDMLSIIKNLRALRSVSTYTLFYCLGDTGGSSRERVLTGPRGAEPNGYLQREEVNPEAKYIATTDPAISTREFSIPKGKRG